MNGNSPILIGVTGGIGAGKSVVCRICALRGIPVYDCDLEARRLMDASAEIHRELRRIVGDEVICSTGINRSLLALSIFRDARVRAQVNTLVHSAVREHLNQRISRSDAPVFIVESAIMHTASLDERMHRIWLVEAPEELRVKRVQARNGLPREQILARMSAQNEEFAALPADRVARIINDDATPLLPQIDNLFNDINI